MSTGSKTSQNFQEAELTNEQPDRIGGGREWICGFLLLGVLLGLTGSLLITWQYHIGADPALIGLHFLSINAGYVLASATVYLPLRRFPLRVLPVTGCLLACASLIALAFSAPPVPVAWRLAGLATLGFAAGLITPASFHILEAYYRTATAYIINLTGALFGCGCTLVTAVLGVTYFAGSVPLEVGLLALVPAVFFFLFLRSRFQPACRAFTRPAASDAAAPSRSRLRKKAAALFSVLLFFQFGNEWVIGSWLALFVIQRLGANPMEAIFILAIHFLALTAGRLAVRPLLPRIEGGALLYGSILVSIGGYLWLSFAPSVWTAGAAGVVVGLGYAPVYPILAESLSSRSAYQPGFYQSIFSIAVTGAMSAPWIAGYIDSWLGIQCVMLLPALGSVAVLLLALLIRREANLAGRNVIAEAA